MRAAALLAAMPLAGCVTVPPADRSDYYCRSLEPAPPGQLSVDVTLRPGDPARDYRMSWETRHGQPGASIRIDGWAGSQPSAPGAHALVVITLAPPGGLTAARHRLELRNRGEGRTIARGGWSARAIPAPIVLVRWGQLRDEMGRGGVEAVLVDRSGRILVRDTLPPELREAPALGAEAARRRWAGPIGSPARACPQGTTQMQLVVVASG